MLALITYECELLIVYLQRFPHVRSLNFTVETHKLCVIVIYRKGLVIKGVMRLSGMVKDILILWLFDKNKTLAIVIYCRIFVTQNVKWVSCMVRVIVVYGC